MKPLYLYRDAAGYRENTFTGISVEATIKGKLHILQ